MSQMFVGIDVSLKSHHVQFMNEDGTSIASFVVSHNQTGADTLIKKTLETCEKHELNSMKIWMEATSNLGWHLAHYLRDQLQLISNHIYVLNARMIARFKKGYDSLVKNNRIDDWVIADHLRFGQLPNEMENIFILKPYGV